MVSRMMALGAALAILAACSGGESPSGDPGAAARGGTGRDAGGASEGGASDSSVADPDGPAASCKTYLACLLLTSPQAYGAAIQVYGEDTACWRTAEQRAGCAQACTSAFEDLDGACACDGAECTKCQPVPNSFYELDVGDSTLECDGGQQWAFQAFEGVFDRRKGRGVEFLARSSSVRPGPSTAPDISRALGRKIAGTVPCSGPFTLSGDGTMTFTPTLTGFVATGSVSVSRFDRTVTCSVTIRMRPQ